MTGRDSLEGGEERGRGGNFPHFKPPRDEGVCVGGVEREDGGGRDIMEVACLGSWVAGGRDGGCLSVGKGDRVAGALGPVPVCLFLSFPVPALSRPSCLSSVHPVR